MTQNLSRREFLQAGGFAVLGAAAMGSEVLTGIAQGQSSRDSWKQGDLVHLLPAVNHERIFLKASFRAPLVEKPRLRAGSFTAEGIGDLEFGTWDLVLC